MTVTVTGEGGNRNREIAQTFYNFFELCSAPRRPSVTGQLGMTLACCSFRR